MKDSSTSSVRSSLATVPAAFQQVLLKILRKFRGIQFYLDDIIVYGKSQQEHDVILH